MVVAEALAHGVPVIASTGTPWSALNDVGAGLWIDNRPEVFARGVEEMATRDLASMGDRGRRWMESEYSWEAVAERMLNLYRSMLN